MTIGGTGIKDIWVLPEINREDEEIGKVGLGLLSEARRIAKKANGAVTAIVFAENDRNVPDIFAEYGVSRAYVFRDPLLAYSSVEARAAAVLPVIKEDKPWLFMMVNTPLGKELAPLLAAKLDIGLVTDCTRIDLTDPEHPVFFRPVYAGQLYQEIGLSSSETMLITMSPDALSVAPAAEAVAFEKITIKPDLPPEAVKVQHVEYLPADFQEVDVADARTVVTAGMGAAPDDILPLVEELATLLEGAVGATRPVVDEGKISSERMVGQTGRVVSPDFYLALGISGASHHVGGIRDSGRIVAVNRDPQAPIFRSADFGISADLRDVLPELITRIKQARENGEIV
jgi:electron transfer flavoprotein alpha subunit